MHLKLVAFNGRYIHSCLALFYVREELRRRLPPQMEVRLFNYLLSRLTQQKQVVLEKDLVRLASHRVQLAVD